MNTIFIWRFKIISTITNTCNTSAFEKNYNVRTALNTRTTSVTYYKNAITSTTADKNTVTVSLSVKAF